MSDKVMKSFEVGRMNPYQFRFEDAKLIFIRVPITGKAISPLFLHIVYVLIG